MQKELTIISWNVNGIRAILKKGFMSFLQTYDPDILCLQETKAERGQVEIDLPGIEEYWNSAQKKGYSGTAIFTKEKPMSVEFDLFSGEKIDLIDNDKRDASIEGRVVTAEFEKFYVVCVYTPNAKDDLSRIPLRYNKWDPLFLKHLKNLEKKKPVIACGDFNVAHEEIDLARPKENVRLKGFTAEERERFGDFVRAGFLDTFREFHPGEGGHYTWWSHWANARARNIGWRIDYVLASKQLQKNITEAFILPEVLGSDHCPVGVKMKV